MDTKECLFNPNSSFFFKDAEMSPEAFVSVNVPISVFGTVLNIIFIFCMIFPHTGTARQKHLLTVLLGLLVGCNIVVYVCVLVYVYYNFSCLPFLVWWYVPTVAIYTMMTSVNSSHWLNIFYCFRIIPVQRPYFIWVKKNIAVIIYSALTVNAVVCLLGMSVNIAETVISNGDNTTNSTVDWTSFEHSFDAALWMALSLFFLSLCVMVASSCTTVVFLWRHMKNMEMSSDSSPRRQRNIKMTIISIIVQAVLHIICSALVTADIIIIYVSPWYFDFENNILCTVISLYSFGTTINMCVSQSVFRQRAVHVWQKIFQPHSSVSVSTVAHTISSDILSS